MEIIEHKSLHANPEKVYPFSFVGTGGAYFGIAIVNIILKIFTLGLYYPWAKAKELQYLYGATSFDESRFEFHGTGAEMFKGFIKALIIFALIIGGFIAAMVMQMPILGFIWYIGGFMIILPIIIHGSYKYRMSRTSWRGIRFGYRGDRKEFTILFFKELFFTIISLGIYGSWMAINLRNYVLSNIRFGSAEFKYSGRGGEYFVLNLKGYFLTLITLGIYMFWWQKDLFNYYINNLTLHHKEGKIRLKSTASGGDFFGLIIVNLLIMIFTLGIGYPWILTRTLKFIFSKIEIVGNIDTDQLVQTEKEYTDATGEDMSDMLDLGFVI
ncbi:MAG: DUF898 domain-containing protein [Bacteroidetes bacterium]|nr:DUF898 domain-containing protein [Bacteroidota bacterium]